MQVKSQYLQPSLSYNLSLRSLFCLFLSGRFTQVLLYLSVSVGLRTGDAPDVAAIVQEKFDMELEMAKTLIQQECEETIESEQVRRLFPLCICFIRPCHITKRILHECSCFIEYKSMNVRFYLSYDNYFEI